MDVLDVIEEGDAGAMAGANPSLFQAGGASVVVGGDAVVVIADPNDDPLLSGVKGEFTFALYGPAPVELQSAIFNDSTGRSILLFVRIDSGCMFVGNGILAQGELGHDRFVSCHFDIEPALERQTLDTVRPVAVPNGLPGMAFVKESSAEGFVRRFAADWIPEVAGAGFDVEAGWPDAVPDSIAAYLQVARHRPSLLGSENKIIPPSRWTVDETSSLAVFAYAVDGEVRWLLDPTDPDPLIWVADGTKNPYMDGQERVGSFLAKFAVFETMSDLPYVAWCPDAPAGATEAVTSRFSSLGLGPWRLPHRRVFFHGAPGLLVATTEEEDTGKISMRVGAVHRHPMRPLAEMGIPWLGFSG